jgi:Zn-dependent M28 family amino/carboxypeptidase
MRAGSPGLLALAKLLQAHPPAQPVELVAYTLEEPPFFRSSDMGSVRHAQALKASGRPVRAVLVLEMIGTFADTGDSQNYPLPGLSMLYGSRGDYLAVVGSVGQGLFVRKVKAAFRAATGLSIKSINAPSSIPGIDFSDHRSYWAEGLPAIMFTDTAFYRNPRYHTGADMPDQLNFPRMAEAVRGVYGVIQKLSAP